MQANERILTFRADSAEENTLPKSYKDQINILKIKLPNLIKRKHNLQQGKMITSTLESFPSSNTLKIAKPPGVSNSRSIITSF